MFISKESNYKQAENTGVSSYLSSLLSTVSGLAVWKDDNSVATSSNTTAHAL